MSDLKIWSSPEPRIVAAGDTLGLSLLREALSGAAVVGLDAEWKPSSSRAAKASSGAGAGAPVAPPLFPAVTLLQIACRPRRGRPAGGVDVFLVDLLPVPFPAIYELLVELFVAPDVLKLGFKFKQDLLYLSSTFRSHGCDAGFDRVEPFLDITSIYHHLKNQGSTRRAPKQNKSLASICEELLEIPLSKELQCSDWSCRPLTRGQIAYAAADAYFLLEIFGIFEVKLLDGGMFRSAELELSEGVGLQKILAEEPTVSDDDWKLKCQPCDAVDSTQSSIGSDRTFDEATSYIVANYGERILLNEMDKGPRKSRRKEKRQSSAIVNCIRHQDGEGIWQVSSHWDSSFGSDECPKFLCDVMVHGLARHLRCVGIDAAIPSSKKPEPRHLLDQAYKEKRVLLTRDSKILKYQYSASNQVYIVKNLLKNDQLLEVIEAFRLKISEDQLMTRCTKCNGSFVQKPLSMEEAIAASKGFQVIPKCLFNRNIEFWQCRSCKQLYWEGTQYQNAVQKFITVCKLGE